MQQVVSSLVGVQAKGMRKAPLRWHSFARSAAVCAIAGLVACCAGEMDPTIVKVDAGEAAAAPTPPIQTQEGPRHIIVRPGQSLGAIARRYGVPERDIIAANQMKPPYRLTAGAQLLFPTIVRRGQSLNTIARSHHVAESAIVAANELKPPYRLAAGTQLLIPITVRPGESLRTITRSRHVSESAIVEANQLKPPYRLIAGTQLLIPSAPTTPSDRLVAAATNQEVIAPNNSGPAISRTTPVSPPAAAAATLVAEDAATVTQKAVPSSAATGTAESALKPGDPASAPTSASSSQSSRPSESANIQVGAIASDKLPEVVASSPPRAQPSPDQTSQTAAPGAVDESSETQDRFVAAITQARDRYRTASEEPTRRSIRASRKASICEVLGSLAVKGWVGTIDRVSSGSNGKGTLKVSIGSGIRAKTWENLLTDIGYDTLIDADSRLFRTVSAMKEGSRVKISGTLVSSDFDCAKVASTTRDQAMMEPEFIFRFSSVSPIQ